MNQGTNYKVYRIGTHWIEVIDIILPGDKQESPMIYINGSLSDCKVNTYRNIAENDFGEFYKRIHFGQSEYNKEVLEICHIELYPEQYL